MTDPGDEVLTHYDYGPDSGPNNLLLRGQTVTAVDDGAVTILRTCYAYDALGRKIGETQPNTNLASCPAGPPTTAMPFTSSTRYDAANRVTGTIAPDPDGGGPLRHPAVRNSYDPAGRLVKVETGELAAWQSEAVAPSAWTGFTVFRTLDTAYDMMGRKISESLRHGDAATVYTMTQYSYDAAGRLECTAVRMNPAAFAALPASACALGTEGSHGPDRITRTVYDAADQRLQVRLGVGTAIEGTQATWAYNLAGQITTVIDGNGNRAALRYDGHGRQSCWLFPSPTRPLSYDDSTPATALATAGSVNGDCIDTGDFERYGYDENGNRTSLRKRDNNILAYEYDALNRMIVKTVPERPAPHPFPLAPAQTRDVYYAYDLRGLQTDARFDSLSGEGIANTYDGFGRLATSSTNMGGTTRTLGYQYDRNGNRTRVTHPDGIYFNTGHDGLGRTVSIADPGTERFIAGYTPHGGPSAVIRANLTFVIYGYGPLQRLGYIAMGHDFPGYTPDVTIMADRNPAGQISTISRNNDAYVWTRHYAANRPYTTNGLNQYSAASGTVFAYDANGNLVSETPPSPAPARAYTYDIENRLVGASGGVTLAYDPLGRLFSASSPGTYTRFLYDGDALVGEYDSTGAMTRRYVHNAGADVPLLSYAGSGLGQLSYLHADHQGSIVAVSDSTGASAINTYDEYGIPGLGNSGRFQYTGQAWLAELGMYHYKARVYSPTLGRFLQTDPVGYEDQYNLYAYVGNDPVNRIDPSGLCFQDDNGKYLGVCAFSSAEGDFVTDLLKIPEVHDFDVEAATAGRLVFVREAETTLGSERTPSVAVPGERVEVEEEGERKIIVNINRNDRTVVFGYDQRSGRPMDYGNTPEDNAVHGLLGHARDEVLGRNTGEVSGIEAENRNHLRNGNPFRREGSDGRVTRRRGN